MFAIKYSFRHPAHFATFLFVFGVVSLISTELFGAEVTDESARLGMALPLWSVIPFVGILLSIAIFPLITPRWWHLHFPKVSAFWALAFAIPFLLIFRVEAAHEILRVYLHEYIPFIILLWALFTVAGGIYVKGTFKGSPMTNALMLLIGTAIASWVGTTGASMILLRPVLRANAWRKHKVHVVVFFIFLVSNIGGSLTPLGDPPLFLGFLQGVPFFWTMKLLPEMTFLTVVLLAIFYLLDRYYHRKEVARPSMKAEPVRIEGAHNILILLGIVGSVLLSGLWHAGDVHILGVHLTVQGLIRDGLLILAGIVSLKTTTEEIHKANGFTWFPIQEVAYLFAGIFMTIIPALAILKAGAEGGFRFLVDSLNDPVHYFWITGSLSSFLDNAPTYLTFFNSLLGQFYAGIPEAQGVSLMVIEKIPHLKAISTGAVFMGAMTYIGNAPNFMVKSITEEAGVRMPSFFGYLVKYSIPILIPLFLVATWIFI